MEKRNSIHRKAVRAVSLEPSCGVLLTPDSAASDKRHVYLVFIVGEAGAASLFSPPSPFLLGDRGAERRVVCRG